MTQEELSDIVEKAYIALGWHYKIELNKLHDMNMLIFGADIPALIAHIIAFAVIAGDTKYEAINGFLGATQIVLTESQMWEVNRIIIGMDYDKLVTSVHDFNTYIN